MLVKHILARFAGGGIELTWPSFDRCLCSDSGVVFAVLPSHLDMLIFPNHWSLSMSGSFETSTLAVIVMCPPALHLDQREFCERPLPGYHLALQGPLSMHQFLYSALDQSDPDHGRKMASLDLASLSWVVNPGFFVAVSRCILLTEEYRLKQSIVHG
jgi:hypothetical protein